MTEKPLEQMGLRDLREIMRQKAPAEAWKHFNGAAESKATFHRNPRAFSQYLFRQKIFHDVCEPDISIELFGKTVPIPAITAPVGSFCLWERCRARSCRRMRSRRCHDVRQSGSEVRPEKWRDADKSPLVFMAYMNPVKTSLGPRQTRRGSWFRGGRDHHGYGSPVRSATKCRSRLKTANRARATNRRLKTSNG